MKINFKNTIFVISMMGICAPSLQVHAENRWAPQQADNSNWQPSSWPVYNKPQTFNSPPPQSRHPSTQLSPDPQPTSTQTTSAQITKNTPHNRAPQMPYNYQAPDTKKPNTGNYSTNTYNGGPPSQYRSYPTPYYTAPGYGGPNYAAPYYGAPYGPYNNVPAYNQPRYYPYRNNSGRGNNWGNNNWSNNNRGNNSWNNNKFWGRSGPGTWTNPNKGNMEQGWDDMINAPSRMGTMPGGWNAPEITMPNPIDMGDQLQDNIKDLPEQIRNMDVGNN